MNTRQAIPSLYDSTQYLIDEEVGIIGHVGEVPREPGAPTFFHYYAKCGNTRAFCEQKNFGDTGGASSDRCLAMAKAVGEAVERYCAAYYRADDLPLCSYDAATFECVSPADFALYDLRQYDSADFPYVPFTKSTVIRWTPAMDALTKDTCYVPAAMVFIPYFNNRDRGESSIVQPISTGLACHVSTAKAAVSAICEVIERDAFTIMWQARLGMPQIKQDTLSDANRNLIERFTVTGSSIIVLNITMDHGVPTILSVLRASSMESPALVFAAAADPDPEQATRKSLEELAHTRRHAQSLTRSLPALAPGTSYENINSLDRHLRMYCNYENSRLAEFVFSSRSVCNFQDIENLATDFPEKDMETLVNRVSTVAHRVLLVDITTSDIESLGLKVFRAIIPGFHPLFMGHRFRALGGYRLWSVPQQLGYAGISRESGDNPAPHPYP